MLSSKQYRLIFSFSLEHIELSPTKLVKAFEYYAIRPLESYCSPLNGKSKSQKTCQGLVKELLITAENQRYIQFKKQVRYKLR